MNYYLAKNHAFKSGSSRAITSEAPSSDLPKPYTAPKATAFSWKAKGPSRYGDNYSEFTLQT